MRKWKIPSYPEMAMVVFGVFFPGSLESAYSLNWGAQEIRGKGGEETLAHLW